MAGMPDRSGHRVGDGQRRPITHGFLVWVGHGNGLSCRSVLLFMAGFPLDKPLQDVDSTPTPVVGKVRRDTARDRYGQQPLLPHAKAASLLQMSHQQVSASADQPFRFVHVTPCAANNDDPSV